MSFEHVILTMAHIGSPVARGPGSQIPSGAALVAGAERCGQPATARARRGLENGLGRLGMSCGLTWVMSLVMSSRLPWGMSLGMSLRMFPRVSLALSLQLSWVMSWGTTLRYLFCGVSCLLGVVFGEVFRDVLQGCLLGLGGMSVADILFLRDSFGGSLGTGVLGRLLCGCLCGPLGVTLGVSLEGVLW